MAKAMNSTLREYRIVAFFKDFHIINILNNGRAQGWSQNKSISLRCSFLIINQVFNQFLRAWSLTTYMIPNFDW